MTATPPTLTPVTEDIPAGATNWLQKITDRWVAVGDNFDEVLAYAQAVASQSAQSVNGHAPDGTGNVTVPIPGAANIQVFLASGTWTKPAGCTTVFTIAVGGGQGGGSGPQSTHINNTAVGNTNGYTSPVAAAGAYSTRTVAAALLPSTVAVAVAAGGAGNPAQAATGSAAAGLAGSVGGQSSFGVYCVAPGGGSTSTQASEANPTTIGPGNGGQPAGLAAGTGSGPTVSVAATTGATPKGAVGVGGTAGTNGTHVSSGAAANGGAGTAGSSDTSGGFGLGGGGGPGGYGGTLYGGTGTPGNGGAGGAGGFPGGGGGSGGADGGALSLTSSVLTGAGGLGGAGVVVVISYF